MGLAALVLLLFRQAVFFGGVFFQRDVQLMWYTQVETFVRAVAEGAWPVWDPFLAFGQPLWADANVQLGYPPTWLNLLVRPWTYYAAFVIVHFVGGALGVYALGRRLTLSPTAAWVAGAAWATSGPIVSSAPMWNQLAGAAWLPWAVLAAETALETGRPVHAVAWGATLAAPALAGSPEGALTAALVGIALGVARLVSAPDAALRQRVLKRSSLAGLMAVGLSAAQWLPTLEAARQSARATLPAEARTYWSVHPLLLVQTVLPLLVDTQGLRPDRAALLSDAREPFFASLYLGLATSALVLAAWAGPPRRRRRFLSLAMAAAILVALGRHTPAYELAVGLLPPLRALRYPAKTMALAALAWALLAGMGLYTWREGRLTGRRFRLRVVGPVTVLALLAGVAVLALAGDPDRWGALVLAGPAPGLSFADLLAPTKRRLLTALGAAVAVLVVAALGDRIESRARMAVLALCAVGDPFLAHQGLNPTAPAALYTYRPPTLDLIRGGGDGRIYAYDYFFAGRSQGYLERPAPYAVARAPTGWPVRAAQALAMRQYLFPPTPGPWGREGSYDLDVSGLGSPHVARLVAALHAAESTPAWLRLLRIGAVSHVVALHEAGLDGLEPVGTVAGLFPEPIRVFRVPDPLPRTYAVGSARAIDAETALRSLLDPAFEPEREVLLDGGPSVAAEPSFAGASRVAARQADRVQLDADLSADGYVVLVDAWDPGWRAWVDERPSAVLRANLAFRAVAVGAGRHLIDMRYRPATLPWGLAISLLAVAAGAAVLAGSARPSG
ncbi:MAG: hypothetical protein DMF80_08710 [Acidobacteria bacterium]|nr:MAG: hypothetical protein DMF80_08710 [Acidobacteriota bacterium]